MIVFVIMSVDIIVRLVSIVVGDSSGTHVSVPDTVRAHC